MGWTYTAGPDRRTESNTGQATDTGAGRNVWQCTAEYSVPGSSGMCYRKNSEGNGDDERTAERMASRAHRTDAKNSREVGNARIPVKSRDFDPCDMLPWQHGDNCSPPVDTDTCASACAANSDHDATFLGKPKDVCKCKSTAYQEKDTYDLMDSYLCQPPLTNSKLYGQKDYKETDSDGTSVDSLDACFSPFQTSCNTWECHTEETSSFLNYGTSVDPVYDYQHHQTEHDADCQTIPCQSKGTSLDVNGYCQCLQECSDENRQTEISHWGNNSSQKSEGSSVDPVSADKFVIRHDLDNEICTHHIYNTSFCQCYDRRGIPLESDKNNAASVSCQYDPVNVKTDFFCQCPSSGSYHQCGRDLIPCVSVLSSPGSLSIGNSGSCQCVCHSTWVAKSYRVLLVEGGRCYGNAAAFTKWLTEQQNANNSSNSSHVITTHVLCERLENEHGIDALRLNSNASLLGLPVGLVLGVATALLSKRCQI